MRYAYILNCPYRRRVDALVEDTRIQGVHRGPGLVPVALHGAQGVGHFAHWVLEPPSQPTGIARDKCIIGLNYVPVALHGVHGVGHLAQGIPGLYNPVHTVGIARDTCIIGLNYVPVALHGAQGVEHFAQGILEPPPSPQA